jgi:hypothetical protein
MSENKNSIHPLVATAAGAVILASLVGVASMTGMLPSKNQAATVAASVPVVVDVAMAASVPAPVLTATPDEGLNKKSLRPLLWLSLNLLFKLNQNLL